MTVQTLAETQSFDAPVEVRTFDKGRLDLITVAGGLIESSDKVASGAAKEAKAAAAEAKHAAEERGAPAQVVQFASQRGGVSAQIGRLDGYDHIETDGFDNLRL